MDLLINREDIGIRLVEERTRLGYSQADFAHQTNVSREALRLNEIGKSGMSAEFLARAAQLGLDVQYVVIGIRSNNQPITEKETKSSNNQSVSGDHNNVVYGNGTINSGTINNVTTEKYITKTKAIIEPNEKHINDDMARKLKDLVDEIVMLESKMKQKPKGFQAVWATLNRHCGVTTYRLIPLELYDKAETYLRKWIGRLTSTKSAPKKLANDWRKKKYAFIKTNVSKYGLEVWEKEHLQERYAVGSITELSNDQLEKFYHSVAHKKRTLSK